MYHSLVLEITVAIIPELANQPEDTEELLGVKYAELTPVLIKAI